jgi:hypothetical protein
MFDCLLHVCQPVCLSVFSICLFVATYFLVSEGGTISRSSDWVNTLLAFLSSRSNSVLDINININIKTAKNKEEETIKQKKLSISKTVEATLCDHFGTEINWITLTKCYQ